MKYLPLMLGLVALCAASCSSEKKEAKCDDNCDAKCEAPALATSEWQLAQYANADSMATANGEFVMTFVNDSTFSMTTDCNVINGQYAVNGDSIAFTNLMTTRMMGPEMVVDSTFNATLPAVQTITLTDSTLTLQVDGTPFASFNKK